MTRQQIEILTGAISRWAERYPYPSEPVLVLAGRSYTAKELATEVKKQTPTGLLELKVFQHAIESGESFEDVIQELEKAGKDWCP